MKRFALCIAMVAAVTLAGTAWAGEDKTEQPLRLELSLVDGSRVIGLPGIESVPVQTTYAKMDIPLKQIQCVKIGEDHETASIDLQNGDKIKGVINIGPIKLETVFGKVAIGIEHIKDISVILTGGTLPETLKKGLILHYSFDRDENGIVTDESGNSHTVKVYGAVPAKGRDGRANGAYFFNRNTNSDRIEVQGIDLANKSFSLCVWVKKIAGGVGAGGAYFFGQGPPYSNTGLHFGMYYGTDPLAVRFGFYNNDIDTSVNSKTFNWEGEWHFMAATYDVETQARELYRDGVCVASDIATANYAGNGPLCIGSVPMSWTGGRFHGDLDDVRIYNRTLTGKEIQQIYEVQKR